MSADNGVYILRTTEGHCRVAHAQAIDNLWYDEKTGRASDYPVDNEMIRIFGNSEVYNTMESAWEKAKEILKELPVCEYGISFIDAEREWPDVV